MQRDLLEIDSGWTFRQGDFDGAWRPSFDDTGWRKLDVPHDWSVEGTPQRHNPSGPKGGFYPGGVGWYRRRLLVPEAWTDRRVYLCFDGVYWKSDTWFDGHHLGFRPNGYVPMRYDITPFIRPGREQIIAVRADNSEQPNSRWYTGSGIYRPVWIETAPPLFLARAHTMISVLPAISRRTRPPDMPWNLRVTPEEAGGTAEIRVDYTIRDLRNRRLEAIDGADPSRIQALLIDESGVIAADHEDEVGSEYSESLTLRVDSPNLWSPDTPYLYTLELRLYGSGSIGNEEIDRLRFPVGIRYVGYDPERGMSLNGRPIVMKGVCEHHDAGPLGAVMPRDVLTRRMRILKRMGCNAIRISHNPPSKSFLELCDRVGFLVIDEAFDEWNRGKIPFGYASYFDGWWREDLTAMIRRDRNHPSVIMWSIGNEIPEKIDGEGVRQARELADAIHRLDSTRPVTAGVNAIRAANESGFGDVLDIVGYNGGGGSCFEYEADHRRYPERLMYASEVPHTLQTRGVYRTTTWWRDAGNERIDVPDLTDREIFPDAGEHYRSSYDNALVRISCRDSWRFSRDLPWFMGEFRWTGFDYLGESTAWPLRGWHYGVIDLCGFPKDAYFFYMSQWTDEPMVRILPHWTHPGKEGAEIPVVVYTNCGECELLLNGRSLGRKRSTEPAHPPMSLRWDVPYEAGTLTAVGYRNGTEICRGSYRSAGEPDRIVLELDDGNPLETENGFGGPSHTPMTVESDGSMLHVAATIVDNSGIPVPTANVEIEYTLHSAGSAVIAAVENGDMPDLSPTKPFDPARCSRRTFMGRCMVMIDRGTVESEEDGGFAVEITARGRGLKGETTLRL